MKITGFSINKVSFPLKTPFITALRRVDTMEALHLRIDTAEGLLGWGAASPVKAITGDTTETIIDGIKVIFDSLVGRPFGTMDEILSQVQNTSAESPGARGAVDMALYDIYSKQQNEPICRIMGGEPKKMVCDLTISLGPVEKMVRDARKAAEAGFNTLKIKLGDNGIDDFNRFYQISQAVDCHLRVDANQGWSVEETLRYVDSCDRTGLVIDLLEQPVLASDIEGMRDIRRQIEIPLAADEAVFSPQDAERLIKNEGADIINIKLLKSGGLFQAAKIASLAESAGLECMVGCMMESPIGIAAALNFAAATPVVNYYDLDVPYLLRDDPEGYGFRCEGTSLTPLDSPGLKL